MTEQGVTEAMNMKGNKKGATRTSSNAVIAATPQLSECSSQLHETDLTVHSGFRFQFQSLCKGSVHKVRNLLETFLPLTTESTFWDLLTWMTEHASRQ